MKNNVDFEIGEILLGENNLPSEGNHYIIYYKKIDGIDFQGAMISTSPFRGINIEMDKSHFEVKNNESNEPWGITYKNSYFVPAKLHKFNRMGAFKKVGQLTQLGIEFITKIIAEKKLKTWDVYKQEVRQIKNKMR